MNLKKSYNFHEFLRILKMLMNFRNIVKIADMDGNL